MITRSLSSGLAIAALVSAAPEVAQGAQKTTCVPIAAGLDLPLESPEGKTVSLRRFTGQPLAIVVFVAAVRPTRIALLALRDVEEMVRGSARIVAITPDDSAAAAGEVAHALDLKYAVLSAKNARDFARVFEIKAVPSVLLFDRSGLLCERYVGIPQSAGVVSRLRQLAR